MDITGSLQDTWCTRGVHLYIAVLLRPHALCVVQACVAYHVLDGHLAAAARAHPTTDPPQDWDGQRSEHIATSLFDIRRLNLL